MKNSPTSNSKQSTSLASIKDIKTLAAYVDSQDIRSLSSAVTAACPTLASIGRDFGANTPIIEIQKLILRMATFTGLRENFTHLQSKMLAETLAEMGYFVTLTEMKYFFRLFEQGKYERFYGKDRPNPQIVTASFQSFLDDLETERTRLQPIIHEDYVSGPSVPTPPEIAQHLKEFNSKSLGQISPEQTRENIRNFHERMRNRHKGGLFGVDFEPQLRVPTPEQQAEIDRKIQQAQLLKQKYNEQQK